MEKKKDTKQLEFEVTPESALKVRLRGLFLLLGGAFLTPVFFVLAYFLGLLLALLFGDRGPVKIAASLVAMPLVMGFIGWLELVTGVSFRRLQRVFEKGGMVQMGLTLLVLASAGAFIVGFIYMYNEASRQGWF